VKHRATPSFWHAYRRLSKPLRKLADENFDLLKSDSRHPSLHFKKVGKYWSVRIGLSHRALGVEHEEDVLWFWIGKHDAYDRMIEKR